MLLIVILISALVAVVGMNGFEFYRGPIWFKWGGVRMRCLECGSNMYFDKEARHPCWKCTKCEGTIPKEK